MSQIYQPRRGAREAPAARLESVPSRAPQYGGEAAGGNYAGPAPLSASAVSASAGPIQAAGKRVDDKDREQLALNDVAEDKTGLVTSENLPSGFHFIKRKEALGRLRKQRIGRLAGHAQSETDARLAEAKQIYLNATRQFMANNSANNNWTFDAGAADRGFSRVARRPIVRYLEDGGLVGRSEEEQQAMLRAYSSQGSDEELAPFLIEDIRRYGGVRSDEAMSEDDETALNAYARDSFVGMRQADMYDLAQNFDKDLLVGEGKLTEDEWNTFINNKYSSEIGSVGGLALGLSLAGNPDPDFASSGRPLIEDARKRWDRIRHGDYGER